MNPEQAEAKLHQLRWEEDTKVVNHFGEHVWLKALFVNVEYESVDPRIPGARRIGITECCSVAASCTRHRELEEKP